MYMYIRYRIICNVPNNLEAAAVKMYSVTEDEKVRFVHVMRIVTFTKYGSARFTVIHAAMYYSKTVPCIISVVILFRSFQG